MNTCAAIDLCQGSSSVAEVNVKTESEEYQNHTQPLPVEQGVSKDDHGTQDGEELPCCSDYGTRQWPKVSDRVVNKYLHT